MNNQFKAIVINNTDDKYTASVQTLNNSELPNLPVKLDVLYSTLNYKDGLAITGKGPVVRSFPMVPGIDLVGKVTASDSSEFAIDQLVLLNGFGVGEKYWGAGSTSRC